METLKEILAANIKKLRKAKGWTQNDLAVESGISFRGVQDIEVGKRNPRSETLQAIAGALGVTESEILGTSSPSPDPLTTDRLASAIRAAQHTPDETELLGLFKAASPAQRIAILKTIRHLLKIK